MAYLREQLETRTEELRGHRRLLAGLIEQRPELETLRDLAELQNRQNPPRRVRRNQRRQSPAPLRGALRRAQSFARGGAGCSIGN
jgi:hypothetical protein